VVIYTNTLIKGERCMMKPLNLRRKDFKTSRTLRNMALGLIEIDDHNSIKSAVTKCAELANITDGVLIDYTIFRLVDPND